MLTPILIFDSPRLLTSKQLQLEGEFYQNFMEGGRSVAEFCNTEVEPMFKESDHIHIIGNLLLQSVTCNLHHDIRVNSSCRCWREGRLPGQGRLRGPS